MFIVQLKRFVVCLVTQDCPPVLSLGRLNREECLSYTWLHDKPARLFNDFGIEIECEVESNVPYIFNATQEGTWEPTDEDIKDVEDFLAGGVPQQPR